jgi:hypothetical protein
VPPGFTTDRVTSMNVQLSGPKYNEDQSNAQFSQELLARVSNLPGVTAAGAVSALPLTGTIGWGGIDVEGYTPPSGSELQVDSRTASPDYFRTMQIPLVAGRFFSAGDRIGTQPVAIIDEKFAKRFWPHESPLGKHLWFDPKTPMTIAGVVKAVKQYTLDDEGKIAVYVPQAQRPDQAMYLVVRTSSDPADIARPVTDVVHAMEPAPLSPRYKPCRIVCIIRLPAAGSPRRCCSP